MLASLLVVYPVYKVGRSASLRRSSLGGRCFPLCPRFLARPHGFGFGFGFGLAWLGWLPAPTEDSSSAVPRFHFRSDSPTSSSSLRFQRLARPSVPLARAASDKRQQDERNPMYPTNTKQTVVILAARYRRRTTLIDEFVLPTGEVSTPVSRGRDTSGSSWSRVGLGSEYRTNTLPVNQ